MANNRNNIFIEREKIIVNDMEENTFECDDEDEHKRQKFSSFHQILGPILAGLVTSLYLLEAQKHNV